MHSFHQSSFIKGLCFSSLLAVSLSGLTGCSSGNQETADDQKTLQSLVSASQQGYSSADSQALDDASTLGQLFTALGLNSDVILLSQDNSHLLVAQTPDTLALASQRQNGEEITDTVDCYDAQSMTSWSLPAGGTPEKTESQSCSNSDLSALKEQLLIQQLLGLNIEDANAISVWKTDDSTWTFHNGDNVMNLVISDLYTKDGEADTMVTGFTLQTQLNDSSESGNWQVEIHPESIDQITTLLDDLQE